MADQDCVIRVPRFSEWATSRIEFLLQEYKSTFPGVRAAYGAHSDDARLYGVWIEAMETELKKRWKRI